MSDINLDQMMKRNDDENLLDYHDRFIKIIRENRSKILQDFFSAYSSILSHSPDFSLENICLVEQVGCKSSKGDLITKYWFEYKPIIPESANKEKHPWDTFLKARYDVMVWMRDEQKLSDYEIADSLSMDSAQVRAIFHSMQRMG